MLVEDFTQQANLAPHHLQDRELLMVRISSSEDLNAGQQGGNAFRMSWINVRISGEADVMDSVLIGMDAL